MSAPVRRVQLAPAYLLHHRPYRESGRILEVLVRAEGRLTLFARGVSGPKSRLAALLQPFQPLLLSFTQGRDAGQLTAAECVAPAVPLPAASVMSAFYLNELLLKLTLRHDAAPELFDAYGAALARLRAGVLLRDGPTLPAQIERVDAPDWLWPRDPPIRYRKQVPDAWLRITLHEGRNRQVRRMTAAVGHPTLRLLRTRIGPWSLDGLAPGALRIVAGDGIGVRASTIKP